MARLMGFREYARHRGVTLRAVQEAIRSGRIHTVTDSKGRKRIDYPTADRLWQENTNFSMARSGERPSRDRVIKEIYEAKLAKLAYEEKSRNLVDAEKVKRDALEVARQVRAHVLKIPDRISAELVGITDQAVMHTTLTQMLVNSLHELCNSV